MQAGRREYPGRPVKLSGNMKRVEELLKQQYWIIDILPVQVPKKSEGQYFAVEQFYRTALRGKVQMQKFSLLLKLNCYVDVTLILPETEERTVNPAPDLLRQMMAEREVLLLFDDALITSDPEDTYLTLYHPDARLLALVRTLAGSEGLFVWQPAEEAAREKGGEL